MGSGIAAEIKVSCIIHVISLLVIANTVDINSAIIEKLVIADGHCPNECSIFLSVHSIHDGMWYSDNRYLPATNSDPDQPHLL